MAHVQLAAGVRQHGAGVELGLVRVFGDAVGVIGGPVALRCAFDLGVVVFVLHGNSNWNECGRHTLREKSCPESGRTGSTRTEWSKIVGVSPEPTCGVRHACPTARGLRRVREWPSFPASVPVRHSARALKTDAGHRFSRARGPLRQCLAALIQAHFMF
ncbi:hypothetical protein SDC9_92147 [bioreactor metagenome]|uniref:Uncharacterized protein n=1 Tax=bioreactor metagenome TaxID=1076179 RepID=A0A644ZWW7_9ZZZZ